MVSLIFRELKFKWWRLRTHEGSQNSTSLAEFFRSSCCAINISNYSVHKLKGMGKEKLKRLEAKLTLIHRDPRDYRERTEDKDRRRQKHYIFHHHRSQKRHPRRKEKANKQLRNLYPPWFSPFMELAKKSEAPRLEYLIFLSFELFSYSTANIFTAFHSKGNSL